MKKTILIMLLLLLVSCAWKYQTDTKSLRVFPHDYTIEERDILSLLHSGSNSIVYDFEGNTHFSKLKCSLVDYDSNEILLSNQYNIKSNGSFALTLGLPGDEIMLSIMSDGGSTYQYLEENFVDEFEVSYHTQMNETTIINDDEVILGTIYLRKGKSVGVKSKQSSRVDIAILLENVTRENIYEHIYLIKCQFIE